jgi:YgiT-type zinc finger domain-containing protein
MNCNVPTCPGEYEDELIVHAVEREGQIVVFKDVPARACDACGDVLIAWDVEGWLVRLLESNPKPVATVPVYQFVPQQLDELIGAGRAAGNGRTAK